jgi:hypothetical protein
MTAVAADDARQRAVLHGAGYKERTGLKRWSTEMVG